MGSTFRESKVCQRIGTEIKDEKRRGPMLFGLWILFAISVVVVGFIFVGFCFRHYYLEHRKKLAQSQDARQT